MISLSTFRPAITVNNADADVDVARFASRNRVSLRRYYQVVETSPQRVSRRANSNRVIFESMAHAVLGKKELADSSSWPSGGR